MKTNLQVIEKRETRTDGALEVVDIFPTLQGEGPFVGHPAVFVRLAGCNLQCPGCDTDYTSNRKLWKVEELVPQVEVWAKKALPSYRPLVVITGGEPFRQTLGPFVEALLKKEYRVQIETNGTLYDPSMNGFWHTVVTVCSPKTPKLDTRLMPCIDHLKYVLRDGYVDPNDGLPTSSLLQEAPPARPWSYFNGTVYVQPFDPGEDGPVPLPLHKAEKELNTQAAIASCMKYGYVLCLQIHKIVGLP